MELGEEQAPCLALCLFWDWDVSFQCVHQFTLLWNTLGRRNNCFCRDSKPSCWEKPLGAEEGSRHSWAALDGAQGELPVPHHPPVLVTNRKEPSQV